MSNSEVAAEVSILNTRCSRHAEALATLEMINEWLLINARFTKTVDGLQVTLSQQIEIAQRESAVAQARLGKVLMGVKL